MPLTDDERLAMLVALEKRIKAMLDDAKQQAKYKLMDSYQNSGVDRKAILIDGSKVGDVSISYSTAKPIPKPGCMAEFTEYLDQAGLVERVPVKGWEKRFTNAGDSVIDRESGEIVECMCWEPSRPKSAAVRGCKSDEVLSAMQGKLKQSDPLTLLLED